MAAVAVLVALFAGAAVARSYDQPRPTIEADPGRPADGAAPAAADAGHSADPRFGFAVANVAGPEALQAQLRRVGAASWYTYALSPGADWGPGRAVLLRTGQGGPRFSDDEIAAAARARPGTAWLIGNEPNLPDQDALDGAAYAREFERYRALLRDADPTALIVAPNVQNVDATCRGCEGTTPGRAFLDAWRAAHRAAYGGEPAFDAFGLHLYVLDWDHLPMTNPTASQAELRAARAYLDAVPEWRGRPIWVTEFGVIWGYPGFEFRDQPDGSSKVAPVGRLDEDGMARYVGEMVRYMRAQAGALLVERWFVFANAPSTEPFATAPGGSALFAGPEADAPLTPTGQRYRALALGDPP